MTATLAPAPGAGAGQKWRTALVVAAVGLPAAAWPAIAGPYPVTVAATAIVFALLALSTQLLVGVCDLPTFGQTAYFGVGAYTAALLGEAGHTFGLEQLAAAILVAALAGAITAPVVLRTRGTAFLMTTFAVQSLAATAATQWRPVTGGSEGMPARPVDLWPGGPAVTAPAFVYWYVLAVAAVLGAALAVLMRSRLILVLRGIGAHEQRMTALGHRAGWRLTTGYTVAAALAGAAGALLVVINQFVSPADIGFDVASLVLLAAAIGAGTMTGAIAGAVLIVVVRDMAGVGSGGLSPLLLGVLFLLVAYRRPIAGAIRRRSRA